MCTEWVGCTQASVWVHRGSEQRTIDCSGQRVCMCVYEIHGHTCGEEGPSDLPPCTGLLGMKGWVPGKGGSADLSPWSWEVPSGTESELPGGS